MATIKEKPIDSRQIQKCLYRTFGKHIIFLNAFVFSMWYESDFAYFTKAGYGYEVEIKRSYQDFKADFSKGNKHQDMQSGKGKQNYFSFCFADKALSDQCLKEIPEKYGVYYVGNFFIECIRPPQKLHTNRMDWKDIVVRLSSSYKTKIHRVLFD